MTVAEKTNDGVQRLMKHSMFSPKLLTRIGTWNIRTLYWAGRLAQLLCEFDMYRLDILGISKVRWTDRGKIVSDGKTFHYSRTQDDRHEHGVGIVLSKRAAESMVGWKPISDRIISARFQTSHTRVNPCLNLCADRQRRWRGERWVL